VAYKVVDPKELYRGKTYSSYVVDWFNWFLSADADSRNSGTVVFLRSQGIPRSLKREKGEDIENDSSVSNLYAEDEGYVKKYSNEPNIRVGGDRLQIREDQAVLVPILKAYEWATRPYKDFGIMQDYTGTMIDNGDNPPNTGQITIDGSAVVLPPKSDMNDFRIVTPVFTAVVPEADYGRSVKDFLEDTVAPGHYPTIVDGYFVLLEFSPGRYTVRSFGNAGREIRGPFCAELIYEIEVSPSKKPISQGSSGLLPARQQGSAATLARNEIAIARVLKEKYDKGELSKAEIKKIAGHIKLGAIGDNIIA
jgi:hypothetical protein